MTTTWHLFFFYIYVSSTELPSCVRLQSPANGTLHGNDNSHGAEANFTCFTGFDLFGASALTCNKGVWSSRVPTCKGKRSYFPWPIDLFIKGLFQIFSTKISGSFIQLMLHLHLRAEQVWCSCTKALFYVYFSANCMKIMDLPNGHVFGTRFSHGQVVSFNCKYGYELVGDRSLRCINGRWNSSVPQCKG